MEVAETVETIVQISNIMAVRELTDILNFLEKKIKARSPGCIPGSWIDPDIRVSLGDDDLKTLTRIDPGMRKVYKPVVLNRLSTRQGDLLVLRKKTKLWEFEEYQYWSNQQILVNEELASYITGYGVQK